LDRDQSSSIKLEHFLYELPDDDHPKLIDFGLSTIWEPGTQMTLRCGSLAYMAPEVLKRSYTSQCDLWSLGVASFMLLFGYMPFSGSERNQVQKIKKAKFQIREIEEASPEARAFVQALLVVDPAARLTAEQELAHPWIAQHVCRASTAVDRVTADSLCKFGQASAFQRACLLMVAWSITSEEQGKLRGEFMKMNLGYSGAIQFWEFKQVLEEQFQITVDQAEQIFRMLDVNCDAEIRYSSFLAATITLHDNLLRAAFRRFDADGTGSVTVENLQEVLGTSFAGQAVRKMLCEVDASQEGQMSDKGFAQHLCGCARSATVCGVAARSA